MKTQTTLTKTLLAFLAVTALSLTGCNSMGDVAQQTSSNPTAQNKSQTTPDTNNTKVGAANASASPSQTEADTNTSIITKVSDEDKQRFLDAINAARADTQDCGDEGVFDPAPALTWNDELANAAWEHSNDLAQSNTFSHTGSGTASDTTAQEENLGHGSTFRERIEHQGYVNWRTIGENIAAGYADAQDVVDAWIKSPHHCANLMNPKFNEVGMALVVKDGSDYYQYWSQEFGGTAK